MLVRQTIAVTHLVHICIDRLKKKIIGKRQKKKFKRFHDLKICNISLIIKTLKKKKYLVMI